MIASAAARPAASGGPFDLAAEAAYRTWRARKLERFPRSLGELVVEVRDPRALTPAERAAILDRCTRTNMAVYASGCGADPDKDIPRRLGLQLGLRTLDPNHLADDDGISPLAVWDPPSGDDSPKKTRGEFIPYTNRGIGWHTDGYYNRPERTVRALLLHCVSAAETGGENDLLDHEIAYLRLRDESPDHIRALMAPDAMTIPARMQNGIVERAAQTGPVFSIDADGHLHMRYTARTVSIEWKRDAATAAALAALERVLAEDSPYRFRGRLAPGMGLVCNNVLHTRTPFTDSTAHKRLIYRARYYERASGA